MNLFFDLFFLHKSLPTLSREELRDHAFGDVELFLSYKDKEVGGGYFGAGHSSIWVFNYSFEGDLARAIGNYIPLKAVERNDSTGPASFTLGQTMPGLTLAGVQKELANR